MGVPRSECRTCSADFPICCIAGFQPARPGTQGTTCGLEIRDTADWKSALHYRGIRRVTLLSQLRKFLPNRGLKILH